MEIAAYGFEAVALFATRTHFDYHNPAATADLQEWLADAGLELHGIHAPVSESFVGGRWGPALSLASVDRDRRAQAGGGAGGALHILRRRTTIATRRGAASRSCSRSRSRSASGWRSR